jgi:cyclin B
MRLILVDWLVDVHRKFKLRSTTLFMAINILDRYMQITSESIPKSKFQLLGITSLFIASKYEEIYPPGLGDFVYV